MEKLKPSEIIKWIGISSLVVSSYMFLGGFHVGPISLRLLVSYGLLGYTLLRGKKGYQSTKGIETYFIFLAFYIFISILNLTAFRPSFTKDLIAVHFVCLTAIIAFPRFFKTEASIRGAYIVLVLIFLFNAFVTYLQFNNSPLGWSLGMSINPTELENLAVRQTYMETGDEFQESILMGIMGTPVGNGYFVATLLPIVTCFIWGKFGLKTIWTSVLFVIGVFCVYMIQQRMALVVTAIYIVTILVLKKKNFFSIVFFIIVAFVLAELSQGFDVSGMGRLSNVNDAYRTWTFSVLNDFLGDPRQVLLGYRRVNPEVDIFVFRTMGHTTFLDALRRGGIFLLLVYIVLFFRLCRELVGIVRFSRRVKDYRTLGMALGCLCFLLYSQTHSTGVQSGSILFWTLFMLTVQSYRLKCEALDAT